MNKKLIFFTVALTAGLLTACSSDDEQKQEPPVRHISVEVNQRPMTSDDPAGARSTDTRSAITTTETFSAFSMRGIYSNLTSEYSVSKSNDTWTVTPNTWPGGTENNNTTPFYAFSQGEFQWNNGDPYISFSIDENASTQHDLLVAKNSVAYSDHDGKVPLTFDHACAALAFNVFMSKTLSTNLAGKTLTVSSIMLKNVSNTGKYYFETPEWGDVSGSADYTLNNSDMNITTDPQALSSNYLFVIPQSCGTTDTYLDVTYTISGQTKKSATIPLSENWEAGKQHTINIKLGTKLIQ
ncbi:fimbrillin family protein [Prevotella sp. E13-27]|uniref:fimbrillin family protein n=1 Tax=Prevotella sp. E13-27 TaxID=2938122 RepID=UPI00200A4D75|nr:fimbrillin family protein [Prevotella sp. E13-27]MCK8621370.1 fimbrillin family protein [Prevotella sp. E13-27]